MICDVHVHTKGCEDPGESVKIMDKAGIDRVWLLSPPPELTAKSHRNVMQHAAKMQEADPERIIAFMWIDPRLPEAPEILQEGVEKHNMRGVKMIPDHWFPWEERLFPAYRRIEELGLPILFHSGILFTNMGSSRFCRPAEYEVMLHFPKIRFALAHISWPWTDECLAVLGRMRAHMAGQGRPMEECQMRIDMTPGTPEIWRKDALEKALGYAKSEYLLFGTEGHWDHPEQWRAKVTQDREMLLALGATEADLENIFWNNADKMV